MLRTGRSKTSVVWGAKEFSVMADEESLKVRKGDNSSKFLGQVPKERFLSESKNVRAL